MSFLAKLFEKLPELPIKNNIRYFLAFNKLVPPFIADLSPVKGYVKCYNLKEGDIVVDIGAYPGDYAIYAAKKIGPSGKVIAFEPDPKNRAILQRNISHDKLSNILLIPKGLWSSNTLLNIGDSNGFRSSLSSESTPSNEKIEVVTLDSELNRLNINKVDFIKMDIEGAEVEAIKGCKKTLANNNLNLAIASYHIVEGKKTFHFLEDFLSKEGYTVKTDFPKHLTTYAWKS